MPHIQMYLAATVSLGSLIGRMVCVCVFWRQQRSTHDFSQSWTEQYDSLSSVLSVF